MNVSLRKDEISLLLDLVAGETVHLDDYINSDDPPDDDQRPGVVKRRNIADTLVEKLSNAKYSTRPSRKYKAGGK